MRRWGAWGVLLAALAGLGFWGARILFPGPEHAIRKQLAELARAASITPNEAPAARLFNAQKLGAFFAPDIQVRVDMPGQLVRNFSSRQEIVEAAAFARNTLNSLKVEFMDVTVAVGSDRQSAAAHLTLKADVPGEKVPEVEELSVGFIRSGGDWLIDRVETVNTLR